MDLVRSILDFFHFGLETDYYVEDRFAAFGSPYVGVSCRLSERLRAQVQVSPLLSVTLRRVRMSGLDSSPDGSFSEPAFDLTIGWRGSKWPLLLQWPNDT